jgi:hypothetical protein
MLVSFVDVINKLAITIPRSAAISRGFFNDRNASRDIALLKESSSVMGRE